MSEVNLLNLGSLGIFIYIIARKYFYHDKTIDLSDPYFIFIGFFLLQIISIAASNKPAIEPKGPEIK